MRKIQEKNMSLLGTATSGRSLRIPNNVDDSELYEFIRKLPMDEQIDLFCISEALSLHYQRRDISKTEKSLTIKVLAFFIDEMGNAGFLSALWERNLILSIDRTNLGRELCLYL